MAALPEDELNYTPQKAPFEACIHCKRCETACPGGAIGPKGYDWRRCLRAYEDGPAMPPWVMEKLSCLLGCEARFTFVLLSSAAFSVISTGQVAPVLLI